MWVSRRVQHEWSQARVAVSLCPAVLRRLAPVVTCLLPAASAQSLPVDQSTLQLHLVGHNPVAMSLSCRVVHLWPSLALWLCAQARPPQAALVTCWLLLARVVAVMAPH